MGIHMIFLRFSLIALTLAAAFLLTPAQARTKAVADVPPSHDIIWGAQITLIPPDGAMGRYPRPRANVWPPQDIEFSKAPYAAALPDGRHVMVSQTPQITRVWVGDTGARNFRPQKLPFDRDEAVFPAIEPISDTEVLVAAGSCPPGDNFIYLRTGTIAP